MTIFHQVLEGEDREILHSMLVGRCLDGQCYEFALALRRLTGWSLWALSSHEHAIRHLLVKDEEGVLWDVRGPLRDLQEIGQPFGVDQPYDLYEVTVDDIRRVRRIDADAIETCMRVIEVLWPNVARTESRMRRQEAFLRELEELSRAHGIWVRAPTEAQHMWPILTEAFGEEVGYTMAPSLDANAYMFHRRLR